MASRASIAPLPPATLGVMSTSAGFVSLHTSVPRSRVEWELEDGVKVPQTSPHSRAVHLLIDVLETWAERTGLSANVEDDIAVRWDQANPRVGVDPDVSMFSPRNSDLPKLRSVRTWLPGHTPPMLAVEIVSENHPWKDYAIAPEKYAANGTEELWVFDADLIGPKATGGPFRLQVWERREDGGFERVYAGPGPARSTRLEAWIVLTDEHQRIRVADDREGLALWPTAAERERAEKERERAEKERERAEKERAIAELAALKAELARTSR